MEKRILKSLCSHKLMSKSLADKLVRHTEVYVTLLRFLRNNKIEDVGLRIADENFYAYSDQEFSLFVEIVSPIKSSLPNNLVIGGVEDVHVIHEADEQWGNPLLDFSDRIDLPNGEVLFITPEETKINAGHLASILPRLIALREESQLSKTPL